SAVGLPCLSCHQLLLFFFPAGKPLCLVFLAAAESFTYLRESGIPGKNLRYFLSRICPLNVQYAGSPSFFKPAFYRYYCRVLSVYRYKNWAERRKTAGLLARPFAMPADFSAHQVHRRSASEYS